MHLRDLFLVRCVSLSAYQRLRKVPGTLRGWNSWMKAALVQ